MTKYKYMGKEFKVTPDSMIRPRFYNVSGLNTKGKENLLKETEGHIDGWTKQHAVENAKRFIRGEMTRY